MANHTQDTWALEKTITVCLIAVIAQILGIFIEQQAEIREKRQFLTHTPIKPSSKPIHGTYIDRVPYCVSEYARTETNDYCGIHVGDAVLDNYTKVQTLYFARLFFKDKTIVYAEIIPERNLWNGFNNFYLQAWTN